MLFVTLIAALVFRAEAKPIGSLLIVDQNVTAYFTDILDNFWQVQQNGYPDLGIPTMDPYTTGGFSINYENTVEGITYMQLNIAEGVLLGESNATITDVQATTNDYITYEITYTWTTGIWNFTAPYTGQFLVQNETLSASGVFSLISTTSEQNWAVDAIKEEDTYIAPTPSVVMGLPDWVLTLTNVPTAARKEVYNKLESIVTYTLQNIEGDIATVDGELLDEDLMRNPQNQ